MDFVYTISVWLLPVLIAITFHEAAHGYVARYLGDETASRLGRSQPQSTRHIDPLGTIALPGLLAVSRGHHSCLGTPNRCRLIFGRFRNPRIGMVLVAAAGPAMNIALAIAAALEFSSGCLSAGHSRPVGRAESEERAHH